MSQFNLPSIPSFAPACKFGEFNEQKTKTCPFFVKQKRPLQTREVCFALLCFAAVRICINNVKKTRIFSRILSRLSILLRIRFYTKKQRYLLQRIRNMKPASNLPCIYILLRIDPIFAFCYIFRSLYHRSQDRPTPRWVKQIIGYIYIYIYRTNNDRQGNLVLQLVQIKAS